MDVLFLLGGSAIGTLCGLTIGWTVARIGTTTPSYAVFWTVTGATVRWGLAAGLLLWALQRGLTPALLAFAGLWLGRWGIVCWYHRRAAQTTAVYGHPTDESLRR